MDNQNNNIGNSATSKRFGILHIIGVLMVLIGLGELYAGISVLMSPLRSVLGQAGFLLNIIIAELIFGILYIVFGVFIYKNKFLKLSMLILLAFIVVFYFFTSGRMPIFEMFFSGIFFIVLIFQLRGQKSIEGRSQI